MKIKAAVLCGGLGKRLRPLTYYFQKTMIPIGRRQKPLLEYIIRSLKYHGIRDIVLLVGYKYEQIMNYFEDGRRFGVKLEYIIDEPGLTGTGGALLNAYRKGVFEDVENILVYYGDILTPLDLKDLIEYHMARGADVTIAVSSKYQVSVGVVESDDNGRVYSVEEKPWIPIKAVIGILVVRKKTLPVLDNLNRIRGMRNIDIMGDFIPELIKENYKVYAYIYDGVWYDVGTTERYEKLDNNMIERLFGHLFK